MDGKLFTGSHDGTLRVWDASGIRDDTNFGKGDEKGKGQEQSRDMGPNKGPGIKNGQVKPAVNGHSKIMIDDEGYGANGHAQTNGYNLGNVKANGSVGN